MFRYLIRRLLWAFFLFICVTMVTYVIFFVIPANPAALVAGKSATQEDIERAERFYRGSNGTVTTIAPA